MRKLFNSIASSFTLAVRFFTHKQFREYGEMAIRSKEQRDKEHRHKNIVYIECFELDLLAFYRKT